MDLNRVLMSARRRTAFYEHVLDKSDATLSNSSTGLSSCIQWKLGYELIVTPSPGIAESDRPHIFQ